MAKKYYAVKVGLTTGIFETWEECKASVDGYPGALYKSFKTLAEAHAYMGWDGQQLNLFDVADSLDDLMSEKIDYTPEQNEEAPDTEKPFSNSLTAVAYVDGSFNASTGVFGYGVVMFHNGQEIHLKDSYNDEEMASMRRSFRVMRCPKERETTSVWRIDPGSPSGTPSTGVQIPLGTPK